MLSEILFILTSAVTMILATEFVCPMKTETRQPLVLQRIPVTKAEWFKFSDKRTILQHQINEGHERGH